ncbi:GNAT family N-acetyltransferase [uncultured Mucilaginibacter sp.]|uniref:GNAT family N-acetyltransferase n=1 Tax=uncultured Mucilaginibacter sp. TaxID=797541 RepID=UPI0025D40556|nr:GNAT family N-acetyltransferase [uncultured Mucilaginibacter sp.]
MSDVLYNPGWNALVTGNAALAKGHGDVRYFDAEVSPIIGLANFNELLLNDLYNQIPDNTPRVVFTPEDIVIPPSWKLLRYMTGYQMVWEKPANTALDDDIIHSLTHEHVPQMLELTQLTVPGPFSTRTIEFGYYEGIFEDEKLVAMAGQRLNPGMFTEISAVCTHPQYLGKSYARKLLLSQVSRMLAAGNLPFLHVRDDNERAVNVYKHLGFKISSVMNFHFIEKA